MKEFLKYNLLSIAWGLLILILCLLPGKDIPSLTIFEYDKVVHFLIYVVLAFLMYYGWKKQNAFLLLHKQTLLKILLITSAYGFLVEVLQELLTTDRHFDIFDALANSLGAVGGSWFAPRLKKFFRL